MVYYLIICRSLTYAQRTARVMERIGIPCSILRAPKSIAGEGCSHCVRVAERWLTAALKALAQENLTPKRVYLQAGDGSYSEVSL